MASEKEERNPVLKTVRIRLEACSFSLDNNSHGPFMVTGNKPPSSETSLQGVVGRAVTKLDAAAGSLAEVIEIGDRICSLVPLSFPISGNTATEITVSPYASLKLPLEANPVACAAVLPSCLRVYTALHLLARLHKGESVLIACPNDLNLTCSAIQICQSLGLPFFALVADDVGFSAAGQMTSPKGIFKLFGSDVDAFAQACNTFSGNLGFACILDFKNSDAKEPQPVTFCKLVRLLGAFGRIVTDRKGIQIPASDVNVLYLKSGSAHFIFDQTWHLSPLYFGRYKHILFDITDKLMAGKLKPVIGFEADPTKVEEAVAKHDPTVGCTVFKY